MLIGGLNIPLIFASTQIDVGQDYFASGTYLTSVSHKSSINTEPQVRTLKHSSGKYIIAAISVSLPNHLIINVISSTGTLLAQSDVYNVYTSTIIGGVSICEYDANEILIFIGGETAITGFRYNIDTAITTAKITIALGLTGSSGVDKIGKIIYHEDYFHAFYYAYGYSGGTGFGVVRYRLSTDVMSIGASVSESHTGKVLKYEKSIDLYVLGKHK